MVKLLVTVPCKKAVLERFQQDFENELDITFANEDPQIIEKAIKEAEIIIGQKHTYPVSSDGKESIYIGHRFFNGSIPDIQLVKGYETKVKKLKVKI